VGHCKSSDPWKANIYLYTKHLLIKIWSKIQIQDGRSKSNLVQTGPELTTSVYVLPKWRPPTILDLFYPIWTSRDLDGLYFLSQWGNMIESNAAEIL